MAKRASGLPNGIDSFLIDSNRSVIDATSATLVAADTGKTYVVKQSGTTTLTLPATAVGLVYTLVWGGADGGGTIQFAPVAADGIAAAGSAVVNKAAILAAATIKKGDYMKIASGVGATGVTAWHIVDHRGIVTKQP